MKSKLNLNLNFGSFFIVTSHIRYGKKTEEKLRKAIEAGEPPFYGMTNSNIYSVREDQIIKEIREITQ